MSDPVIWPFIGNRSDYPLVVAKLCHTELQTMAAVGVTGLTSNWPKPWVVANEETGERKCSICEEWKSADQFHAKPEGVFGRGGYCIPCNRVYMREHRLRSVA